MGLRRLENSIRGATFVPTPMVSGAGSDRTSDGALRSKVGPVVKVLATVPVIWLPAVSFTPVIVIVYEVLASSGTAGARVSNWLASLNDVVTASTFPPVLSVICPMLVGCMGSLNSTCTVEFVGT